MRPTTPAKATLQEQSPFGQTLWLIQWPSKRKGYYARTQIGSDEISLETLNKRNPVGPAIASKIIGPVRAAIARAQNATH